MRFYWPGKAHLQASPSNLGANSTAPLPYPYLVQFSPKQFYCSYTETVFSIHFETLRECSLVPEPVWYWRTGISVFWVEKAKLIVRLAQWGLSVALESVKTQFLQECCLVEVLSYPRASVWTVFSKNKEIAYFLCSPVSWSIMNFIVLASQQHFLPQQNS